MNLDHEALQRNFELVRRELLGATPFRPQEVKDPFGLVVKFWTPEGVSAHLRERFSWPTLRLLREFDGTPPAPAPLRDAVVAELNQLIEEGPCFYEKRLFALVELTDEARALLKGATEEEERIRLRRLLLEAVYCPAVARSKSYTQKYQILLDQARRLLADKVIHGEMNCEAHFTPKDVVDDAIARMLDGKAVWQPERSGFITFACQVMRSYVDHEVNRSGNKLVESMSRPAHAGGDDGTPAEDETRFSDGGGGHRECEGAAELADVMEMFPAGSLERRLLEAVIRGKGNEKLPEWAAELGVGVKEVRKARASVARLLTEAGYFKRRSQ